MATLAAGQTLAIQLAAGASITLSGAGTVQLSVPGAYHPLRMVNTAPLTLGPFALPRTINIVADPSAPITYTLTGQTAVQLTAPKATVTEDLRPSIDAGTTVPDTLIPWSPSMSTARLWYRAEDALNIANNPAAGGDQVWSIPNATGAVARTTGLALNLVPLAINLATGIAANAPLKRSAQALNGIFPVGMGAGVGGALAHRLGTVVNALSPTVVHRIFVVAQMRGTNFAHLVAVSGTAGNTLVSTNATRQLRAGTDAQVFGAFTDSVPFLTSYERAGTEGLFDNGVAAASAFGRVNGTAATTQTTGGGSTANPNVAFLIGNRYDTDAGADMDFYEAIAIEGKMTQAEIRRMEGYLSWKYGLQANLPGDHPYRSVAPMVVAGTLAQPTHDVMTGQWGFKQVMDGFCPELCGDNIGSNDGAQGTDFSRALPYDLIPSEKARMASMMQGMGPVRFALGIYWRGLTNIDGTSSLAKNMAPRWPGQRKETFDFLRGAGITPEYWSPAPHWKTTSSFGGGVLWAGGANARSVRLDSIKGTDLTGYNAQIALFTTAIVTDLEDLHGHDTYPMRVVGFALQNEPLGADAPYGSCLYDTANGAILYLDVLKSLIPKIRNSAILSKWGGNPNTVKINADSWAGPYDAICTGIVADATVLSTGKTVVQELAAWTVHNAGPFGIDPNSMLTADGISSTGATNSQVYYNQRRAATNPTGIPAFANEFEFFSDVGRPAQFANMVMGWLNFMNYMQAPQIQIIHIGKPSSDVVTERYALFAFRPPGDVSGAATNYASSLGYRQFSTIDVNWNAAKPFLRWLKGAQWLLTQESAYSPTSRVGACINTDGKLVVFALNSAVGPADMRINLGAEPRTMRAVQYSATQRDNYASTTSSYSNTITTTVPGQTLQVFVEI